MKDKIIKKGYKVLALVLAFALAISLVPTSSVSSAQNSSQPSLNETILLQDDFSGASWSASATKGKWRLTSGQYCGLLDTVNGVAPLGWSNTARNLYDGTGASGLSDVHVKADVCVTGEYAPSGKVQYHFLTARGSGADGTGSIAFGFKTVDGATKSSLVVGYYTARDNFTPYYEGKAVYTNGANNRHTLELYVVGTLIIAKCDGETVYAEQHSDVRTSGYCGIVDHRASSNTSGTAYGTDYQKGGYFDNFSLATITLDGFKVNGSVVANKAGQGVADISILSGGVEVTDMDDVNVTVSEIQQTEPTMQYIDLRDESAITLHGFDMDANSVTFSRMDTDVALQIVGGDTSFSKSSVYTHARESAGGRARFSTNSSVIAIKAEFPSYVSDYATEMGAGKTGFDVYVDTETGSTYYGTVAPTNSQLPAENRAWSFEGQIEFDTEETRNITIYFPITNEVSEVSVGVEADATVAANAIAYDDTNPIVYYGSSITQGGVASKPGLTYVNTIGRMLGRDYVDLGVWGSAKGEQKFAEYIAGLDMSVFVFDYDHNCANASELEATHWDFYQTVRTAKPNVPIIFISRPNTSVTDWAECRAVIQGNYDRAKGAGDNNVYFIDGQTFFAGQTDCLADGIHPTDKGHSLMAASIGAKLAEILGKALPTQTTDAGTSSNNLSASLNQGSYLVTLKDALPVTTKTATVDKVYVVADLAKAVTSMSDSRWTGQTATAKANFTVDGSGKATLVGSPSASSALNMLNANGDGTAYGNFYVEYTLTMTELLDSANNYFDQFLCMGSYGTTGNNAWDAFFAFDTRKADSHNQAFWARLATKSGAADHSVTKEYSKNFADPDIGEGQPVKIGMIVCENKITLLINDVEAATYTGTTNYSGWLGLWLGSAGTATVENFLFVPLTKEIVDVEFSCPPTVMQDGTVEVSATPIYSWPYDKGEATTTGVTISGLDTSTEGVKNFKVSYSGIEKELNISVTKKPDAFRVDGPVVATNDGKGIADVTILAGTLEVESLKDVEVNVAGISNAATGLYKGNYEVTMPVYGTARKAVATRVFVVEKLSDAVTTMADSRWTGQTATSKPGFTVDSAGKATLVASASPSEALSILNVGESGGKYSDFYVEYTLTMSNMPAANNAFQNYFCMDDAYGTYDKNSINASVFWDTRTTTSAARKFWMRLLEKDDAKANVWSFSYSDAKEDLGIAEGQPMTIGMLVYEGTATLLLNGEEVLTHASASDYAGRFAMWMGASTGTVTVEDFLYVPLGTKRVEDIEFSYPTRVTPGTNIEVSAIPVYNWPYGKGEAVTSSVTVTGLDTSTLGEKTFQASYQGIEKTLKLTVSNELFREEFEGALSDLADAGWGNVSTSTAALTDEKLYLSGNKEGLYVTDLTGSDTWKDYTVSVDATMTSVGNSATTNAAAVVARSTGLSDGYEWAICIDQEGNAYARLYDRAAKKQIAKVDYPFDLNETYNLKLTVVGNTIKGYVNGEKIVETTADTCTSGTVGVRRNGYAVSFDNLVVTLPEEDAPVADVTKQQIWFTDTFEAETTMSERGWNVDRTIQNGEMILGQKAETVYLTEIPGSANWTDYTAQAKITVIDSDEVSSVGNSVSALIVRSTSAKTGYEFGVSAMSSNDKGGFRLYNRATGETLASTTEVVAERGKTYQLTAVVEGKRIRCFVDGQLIFDVVDSKASNPAGYVGMRTVGYSGAYDDIVVRKITDADRKGQIQSGSGVGTPTTGDAVMSIWTPLATLIVAFSAIVYVLRRRYRANR